ncbi:MAG: hypothetical protein QXJ28_02285 [Candidatus Pacearchaeota archaeon]
MKKRAKNMNNLELNINRDLSFNESYLSDEEIANNQKYFEYTDQNKEEMNLERVMGNTEKKERIIKTYERDQKYIKFYDEGKAFIGGGLESNVFDKVFLLIRYFPNRFGKHGKQPLIGENMSLKYTKAEIGAIFNGVINYSRKIKDRYHSSY